MRQRLGTRHANGPQKSRSDNQRIRANEAFVAQACAVSFDLGRDPAKVKTTGAGIPLAHPIGATGALIIMKALCKLERIGGRKFRRPDFRCRGCNG